MKEELVLFGNYNEIKEWYDSLNIKSRDLLDVADSSDTQTNLEFKPFSEQINEDDVGRVNQICWFQSEVSDEKKMLERPYGEIKFSVKLKIQCKKVCLLLDITDL